ncbi:MAG: peptidoglycan bridge formation glycyltransferase FemA/FemB family protein [Patescibacteria group bacterium]
MQMTHIEQSESWALFQEKVPYRGKVWKIGKSHVVRHKLPRGFCWLSCDRGKLSEKNMTRISKIAREEKAIFFRIEPPQNFKFPKGFHEAHAHYQPEETLVLDLSLSEDALLKQMKEKGRYNIRLAAKKNVTVKQSKDTGKFYKLLAETTQRDKFHSHPKEYYENLLKTLSGADLKKGFAKMFLAEHENEVTAGIIVTFYKDTATYYFGASGDSKRNLMAPYLLQWEAILYAKNLGCRYYDFLGIAPENSRSHPWAGVTEFKKKFG